MGNIRFLQLTLIGMGNFAIPGRNAHVTLLENLLMVLRGERDLIDLN
jgi:hypothetical protein